MENDLRLSIDIEKGFDNWKESIRFRVKTANDTSSRSKYTLIFLSLVSLGIIVSIFSYFYSWNREIASQYLLHKSDINIIRDGVIKEWLSTQTFQLPFIGIKIMASDIQIFGPIILIIVSTWNYYEVRREHFTIGRLLGDIYFMLKDSISKSETKAIILCQEVYHNLIGYTVFNVISYDDPIKNLGEPLVSGKKIGKRSVNIKLRQTVVKFLVFTPLISIVFIAITRILTFVIIESAITGAIHRIDKVTGLRFGLLFLSAFLLLISAYICFINMKRVFRLDNSTRNLLDEYQRWAFEGIIDETKANR
jgi:hypothetical protein